MKILGNNASSLAIAFPSTTCHRLPAYGQHPGVEWRYNDPSHQVKKSNLEVDDNCDFANNLVAQILMAAGRI